MTDNLFWRNRIVESGAADPQELAKGYNPDNWRFHPQIQRDALEDALDSIGVLQPVLFNRLSGKVIDGHLRIELAILKGQPLIPVNYVELTDDEEALALATLDAITEQAEPIADKLAALLERTREMTADRPGLGAMLERLKERAGINGDGQGDNGDEPPMPTETEAERLAKQYGVETGQVWALGRHRIICGDCTDMAIVDTLMMNERANALFNDPPYGMNLEADYKWSKGNEAMGIRPSKGYQPIAGDDGSYDPSPILGMFSYCKEQFWWGADYYIDKIPNNGKDGSFIVWDKKNDDLSEVWTNEFELLWSMARHKKFVMRVLWNGALGTESEDIKKRVHPTQKPVRVYIPVIEKFTKSEDIVFDGYLGSGPTLIACERLNRKCRAIELDPGYAAVSIQRWVDLTGQTPRRVSG